MSQELIYTSAPQGLESGSRGFCTVACTRGMPSNLVKRLEAISGYRHTFPPQEEGQSPNPVNWSHLELSVAGRTYHVLSRICDAGFDYTRRSNKLAHHVVLDTSELPPGGPAALLSLTGMMQSQWDGVPQALPPSGEIPPIDVEADVCRAWQQATGDAGWGGVLAESAATRSPATLIYPAGADVLSLVAESLALLDPSERWQVTFSTYFTKLPAGVECRWRCVLDGTPEAEAARKSRQQLVIDLTAPLATATGGALVEGARTGKIHRVVSAMPQTPTTDQQVQSNRSPRSTAAAAQATGQPSRYAMETPQDELRLEPPALTGSGAKPPPLREFKKKRKSRAPLVLSVTALAMLLAGGGAAFYLLVIAPQQNAVPLKKSALISKPDDGTSAEDVQRKIKEGQEAQQKKKNKAKAEALKKLIDKGNVAEAEAEIKKLSPAMGASSEIEDVKRSLEQEKHRQDKFTIELVAAGKRAKQERNVKILDAIKESAKTHDEKEQFQTTRKKTVKAVATESLAELQNLLQAGNLSDAQEKYKNLLADIQSDPQIQEFKESLDKRSQEEEHKKQHAAFEAQLKAADRAVPFDPKKFDEAAKLATSPEERKREEKARKAAQEREAVARSTKAIKLPDGALSGKLEREYYFPVAPNGTLDLFPPRDTEINITLEKVGNSAWNCMVGDLCIGKFSVSQDKSYVLGFQWDAKGKNENPDAAKNLAICSLKPTVNGQHYWVALGKPDYADAKHLLLLKKLLEGSDENALVKFNENPLSLKHRKGSRVKLLRIEPLPKEYEVKPEPDGSLTILYLKCQTPRNQIRLEARVVPYANDFLSVKLEAGVPADWKSLLFQTESYWEQGQNRMFGDNTSPWLRPKKHIWDQQRIELKSPKDDPLQRLEAEKAKLETDREALPKDDKAEREKKTREIKKLDKTITDARDFWKAMREAAKENLRVHYEVYLELPEGQRRVIVTTEPKSK